MSTQKKDSGDEEVLMNVLKGNIQPGIYVCIHAYNVTQARNEMNAYPAVALEVDEKLLNAGTAFIFTFLDKTAYIKFCPILFETFEKEGDIYMIPVSSLKVLVDH